MQEKKARKKLIYVMGCGRSGTTILGVALGNGRQCLDLGEVVDFLKRKGVPNSYGPETETGKFWEAVTKSVVNQNKDIFDEALVDQLTSLERHNKFPLTYFGLLKNSARRDYSTYINSLYSCISKNSQNTSSYIDSSKYPGRALLLSSHLVDFDVSILHIVRHPVKVIESFSDKSKRDDQGYKSYISANFYYFVINLFCSAARFRVSSRNYLKIRYEDLLQMPKETLDTIASKFEIDLQTVSDSIDKNEPLRKGFIFNGNRMSMGKDTELILKKSGKLAFDRTIKNAVTVLINRVWY